jgi:hypothetical protein
LSLDLETAIYHCWDEMLPSSLCLQPAQALPPGVEVGVEPGSRGGDAEHEPVTLAAVTGSHHDHGASTPAQTPPALVSPFEQQTQLSPGHEMTMLLAQAQLRLQAKLGQHQPAKSVGTGLASRGTSSCCG